MIVTGGARGLGLCVAISLVQAGAPHVYCLDILPSPPDSEWTTAVAACREYEGQLVYKQLDITDASAVSKAMSEIFNECPRQITGVFAAAGIQQMIPALDYPVDQFRRLMEVNVTGMSSSDRGTLISGTFLTIQAAAREFKQRNISGSIVITASMSGSIANKGRR